MALEIINCGYASKKTGEETLKNKLMKLYSNDYGILYIQPKLKNNIADFILIDPKRGISILEVKDWDNDYIRCVNGLEIDNKYGKHYKNPSNQLHEYLNIFKNLLRKCQSLYDEYDRFKVNVTTKVCMTNLTKEDIINKYKLFFATPPIEFLGKNELRSLKIEDIFNGKESVITDKEIEKMRGILFPEIKITENLKLDFTKDETLDEKLKLLDFEQERFAKRIIDGHYMVTGVPGSGKTVIMLSRALFLAKHHPDWKILILTYNKSLSSKLLNRLENLKDELSFVEINTNNIEIITFHKLAMNLVGRCDCKKKSQEFWNEELPKLALGKAYPIYDAVLIDEYQDFDESWLKVCLAVAKKYNDKENFFLAGDRLQSIYKRKDISWKSLGINIQGRSKLLKTSYRTGKSHINVALQFLQNDEKLAKEVSVFYEGASDIQTKGYGEDINFLNDGYSSIGNKIKELLSNGYNPSDILILAPRKEDINDIYNSFDSNLQKITQKSKEVTGNKINLITYHSAKGLESKVCILVSFDNIQDRKLAYVGITRACEHLYIQASDYSRENFATEVRTIAQRDA